MPPSSHSGWKPAADRPDPVALLEEQDATREPDLVPVRHGRMLVSPVHLLPGRGQDHGRRPQGHAPGRPDDAALRRRAPVELRRVRVAERILLFDLNDFDETLPGPFEYDVKRMSASFTIAARNNGFSKAEARDATLTSVAPIGPDGRFAEMRRWTSGMRTFRGRAAGGHRDAVKS